MNNKLTVTKDLRFFIGDVELPKNFITLGEYTKTARVKALKINREFAVEGGGEGNPGDYLVVEKGVSSIVTAEEFGRTFHA